MNNRFRSVLTLTLLGVVSLVGCRATGPSLFRVPVAESYQGPEPGSKEWWAIEANRPPGARQKHVKGKAWPPFARPTGRKQQLSHAFHDIHYWPHPYVCQDRQVVAQYQDIQATNGWMKATTLYDYHFDEQTQQLTKAGRKHLKWIIQYSPISYRMAFVQMVDSPEYSQARLEAVKLAACEISHTTNPLPISLRMADPVGRPAEEVDAIRRAELETLPPPRVTPPLAQAADDGDA